MPPNSPARWSSPGVTSQTAAKDWLFTPYSTRTPMVGVEIHANAFETIAQGLFLTDALPSLVLGFSLLLVLPSVLLQPLHGPRWRTEWPPAFWSLRMLTPYWLFTQRIVFPSARPYRRRGCR